MSQYKVGYASGVFDLFHVGHLNLLRNARALCDHLIVGVVTERVAQGNKGTVPVVPLEERLSIVAAIRYVDEALVDDVPVPEKLVMWERLRFNVVIKGDDWKGTDRGVTFERQFGSVGVAVEYVPYTEHTSSTLLRTVLDRAAAQDWIW